MGTKLFRSMDSARTWLTITARNAAPPRKTRRTISTTRTKRSKGPPFLPSARENEFRDKEKAMKQFAALLRKDNQPVRYLVVDDSVFARKNLIKMIEMFGGEVAGEAGDGLTAIAEFNRINPDIVLMDITMPQMEGIEAVERIVRQHANARIVMVSAVGYQENILAALQKGAKHFVQKPVKPEVLYEILRYVLSDDPNAVGAPVALAGEHRS